MKFVSCLFILGFHRSARPSVTVDALSSCTDDWAQNQYNQYICKTPGEEVTYDRTWHGNLWNNYYTCTGRCCGGDNSYVDADSKCQCLHKGARHDEGKRANGEKWLEDGQWPDMCCSEETPLNGEWAISNAPQTGNNDTHCGCADVGGRALYQEGVLESDCCSGKWVSSSNKTCIPAECTHKGEAFTDHCCGYMTHEGPVAGPTNDGKCKCIPQGQELNRWQEATGSDCCSGALLPGTNVCGCISATDVVLTAGASKDDCCTGATEVNANGEFCTSPTCNPPGQSSAGGLSCCSGEEHEDVCVCLQGGKDLPSGQPATNCCSHTAEDGKCTFLSTGAIPNPYTTNKAAQCASGILDSTGHCACGKPGAELSDSSLQGSHCCSGQFKADSNTCSCISNSGALLAGTNASDCCSRTAQTGACVCAFAGRPAWSEESTGSECCAGYQKGGACGCSESGAQNRPKGMCCGGFSNTSNSDLCRCIPDGTTLAPFVKATACCSGEIASGKCR